MLGVIAKTHLGSLIVAVESCICDLVLLATDKSGHCDFSGVLDFVLTIRMIHSEDVNCIALTARCQPHARSIETQRLDHGVLLTTAHLLEELSLILVSLVKSENRTRLGGSH